MLMHYRDNAVSYGRDRARYGSAWTMLLLLVCSVVVLPVACFPVQPPRAPFAPLAASASCLGPDGSIRCGTQAPRWNRTKSNLANSDSSVLGAASGGDRASVIPPAWTVPAWVIDTPSSSGCASDNNNGTQSTCGAAGSFQGPLLTYSELAERWGTYYPRIQQSTSLTILGSENTSDVIYINPLVESTSGVYFTISCALGAAQQAWTGTLGATSGGPPARSTLLQSVLPASGPATNQLLVNSTHPSRAWTTTNSGTTWNITQPVTGCATAAACSPSEVITWTVGDTITAYTPSNIYLVQALPTAQQDTQVMFVTGCNLQCPGARSTCASFVNSNVIMADSSAFTQENPQDAAGAATAGGGGNLSPYHVNFDSAGSFGSPNYFYGGRVGTGGQFNTMYNANLAGGVELFNSVFFSASAPASLEGGSTFNDVYVNGLANLTSGYSVVTGPIWGPGTLRVEGGSFLQYPSTTGAAVANFLQTGTNEGSVPWALNGATTACSHTGASPDVVSCGISLSATNLDAAQSSSGFGGLAYAVGGGQISKTAQ